MPAPAAGNRIPLGETRKQASAAKSDKASGVAATAGGKAASVRSKAGQAKTTKKADDEKPSGLEVPSPDRSLEEDHDASVGSGGIDKGDEGGLSPQPADRMPEEDLPDQAISMQLVARRGLGKERLAGLSSDEIASEVLQMAHVRLDEERIARIENLEALGDVTHLLLQRNRITRLENLESLQSLQLLSVASNDIMFIENLTCLPCLKALDIGYNLIDEVPPEELPKSLMFLTTECNSLRTMDSDKWAAVYEGLPDLRQHDCRDVPRGDETEDEDEDEDEDEEAEDGSNGDIPAERDGEEAAQERAMLLTKVLGGQGLVRAAAASFDASMAALRARRQTVIDDQRAALGREREAQARARASAEPCLSARPFPQARPGWRGVPGRVPDPTGRVFILCAQEEVYAEAADAIEEMRARLDAARDFPRPPPSEEALPLVKKALPLVGAVAGAGAGARGEALGVAGATELEQD